MKSPIRKWSEIMEGKWETILISLCEVAVGILLLARPIWFTAGIIIAAGVLCMILGLKYGVTYFRTDIIRASVQKDLFKGLLCVGCGLFLILGSGKLSSTQELLNIVYGVALLVLSAEKIQWAANLLRWQKPYWYVTGISAVLTVMLAVLMLTNPFPEKVIWIVVGIALILEAVLDVVALYFAGKKTKIHIEKKVPVSADSSKKKNTKKAEDKEDVKAPEVELSEINAPEAERNEITN